MNLRILSVTVLLALLFCSISAFAAEEPYIASRQGMAAHYGEYDGKGKLTSQSVQIVEKVSGSGNNMTIDYRVDSYEKGQKKPVTTTMTAKVTDGIAYMKYAPVLELEEGMTFTVSGDGIAMPMNMQVGQKLPESTMIMDIAMSGFKMKVTTRYHDMLVAGAEKVTVKAGTYDCLKITGKTTVTAEMMPTTANTEESWVARGIGTVKHVVYDESGAVLSTTILDKIETGGKVSAPNAASSNIY